MRTKILLSFVALTASLAVAAACDSSTDPSSGDDCHAGDREACNCADGSRSVAECVGGKLSNCACVAAAPVEAGSSGSSGTSGSGDGGREGGASTSDAGFGAYMGRCNDTPDCEVAGDTCFVFGTKGKFCTRSCDASDQCPAPSPKCNPKMVCAVPD